jgi:hypothetical protein
VKTHKLMGALVAFAAGSVLLLPAAAAGAAVTGPHHATGVHRTKGPAPLPRRARLPFTLPAGYTVATTTFTAEPGVQSSDFATCPGTEQASGGGAYVDSSDVVVNLNSSFPSGNGAFWNVDVNNASATATGVTVYAVCLAASPSYTIESSGPWDAPSNYVTSEAVDCPGGTSVTGGGAFSDSSATDVNINSTVPNNLGRGRTAWRAAIGSYDPNDSHFIVFAVCEATPAGYSIQTGNGVAMGAYAESEAVATCPGASVPIGGGEFTGFLTSDVGIGLNTSFPYQNTWDVYENNDENLTRSLYPVAICAGS